MARTKDKIDELKLSGWKLLDDFRARLAKAQAAAPKVAEKPGGPERKLLESDYFCLFLCGLLNPVVDAMRGEPSQAGAARLEDPGGSLGGDLAEGAGDAGRCLARRGGGGGGKTFAEVPAAGAGLAAGAWAGKEEYDAFLVKVLEVANRRRTKRLGEELAAMPECGKP